MSNPIDELEEKECLIKCPPSECDCGYYDDDEDDEDNGPVVGGGGGM